MDEKVPYAIMRIAKIRNFAVLDLVDKHNTRQIPAGTVEGAPVPEDLVQMTGTLSDRARETMKALDVTYEKGKVLAVEVLVTASPEWWIEASVDAKKDWLRAQWRFAKDVGGPGFISFIPHLDESTPHVQFVVVPLYYANKGTPGAKPKDPEKIRKRAEEEARAAKIWRLSHHEVFGGSRRKLAALQTRYHGYVAHLGLARGRDTVGLDIKHQTLKEYRKKLNQIELDLAREWDELREERMVLESYDEQVGEKHRELDRMRKEMHDDELRLFAREETMRVQLRSIIRKERALNRRERILDRRKLSIATKNEEIANRENAVVASEVSLKIDTDAMSKIAETLEADRNTIGADQSRLSDERANLASRETKVGDDERRLGMEKFRQKTIADQLSILGGLFAGKLTGKWDVGRNRPAITQGKINDDEATAIVSPWPEWLALATRRAMVMATARSRIAVKVSKILVALRNKRTRVNEQIRGANDQIVAAAQIMTAAKSRIDVATAAERRAHDVNLAANKRAGEAEAAEEAARKKQQKAEEAWSLASDARNAAEKAKGDQSAAEEKARFAGVEYDVLASEKARLKQELPGLRDECEQVDTRLGELRRDFDALRADEATMLANKAAVETDRIAIAAERERFNRSQTLIEDLIANRCSIEIGAVSVRVTPGPDDPDRETKLIMTTDLEPWVPNWIRLYGGLLTAMGQAEELAEVLEERRKLLSQKFPAEAQALAKEQVAETILVAKTLRPPPPQQEGVGW